MPQEVVLANSLRQSIVAIGSVAGSGGAKWQAKMPEFLQMQSKDGKPKRFPVTLPVKGTLLVSFTRPNVTPKAVVDVKISRDAKGVHATATPADAKNLSATIRQSGTPDNEQIIITFKGEETII